MKSILKNILFIALLSFAVLAYAQTKEDAIASFRSVMSVSVPDIKVPTVLEVPLSSVSSDPHIGVYDKTDSKFVPYLVIGGNQKSAVPASITSTIGSGDRSIGDANFATYVQYDLPESGPGFVSITYKYPKAIRSSSMHLALDQYVALPTLVTLKARVNGVDKVVLSNMRPNSTSLSFLETVSDTWTIDLSYAQPLRISELTIENKDVSSVGSSVRFLAQPGHGYEIYQNPETIVFVNVGESGNLSDNTGVRKVQAGASVPNSAYKEADSDSDGIPDIRDNCVRTANKDQADTDGNGRGDVCDDYDRDGIINSNDNCVNEPNQNQRDTDNDGKGDTCDGEESRFTEKYPALVWLGIGFAALVFIALFYVTLRRKHIDETIVPPSTQV
ncbi:MAG TPA: thrombospondin type 3 repeat-containing protein [Candidatus Paceibacterota bacterium]|nr:thrombospondin type 3 repeat-containing protein [Candidatus Paceibacterota bacterium]